MIVHNPEAKYGYPLQYGYVVAPPMWSNHPFFERNRSISESSWSQTTDSSDEMYISNSDSDNSLSGGGSRINTGTDSQCCWKGCGLWFESLEKLANHITKSHAASTNGLFYCQWDGCTRNLRGFNARYKMIVHVRTHTNEKPHQCHECQKSFSRAENLKIHLRSHSGEKPYACPVPGCTKAYSNSSDRFKHTRTHQVDKPYVCKVEGCSKRYTDPSSLRKHVKAYQHYVQPVVPEVHSFVPECNCKHTCQRLWQPFGEDMPLDLSIHRGVLV